MNQSSEDNILNFKVQIEEVYLKTIYLSQAEKRSYKQAVILL